MKTLLMAAAALMAMGAANAAAVLDMQLDGYVGNTEATIAACKKIAPVGTKRLADAIAKAVKAEKQNMDALRKSPGYAREFKKEADRWHYLSDSNRTAQCRKLNDVQYP